MTSALAAPLTPTERDRLVGVVDAALTSFGLPAYSQIEADLVLAHVGFNAAARERAIGLTSAENRRLRIALAIFRQEVTCLQDLLTAGRYEDAAHAVYVLLPELRALSHKMKPTALPAGVASLDQARERRDGAL